MRYDFIVIGAGPAGMMAAGTAAKEGARVLLLDKNKRPGRKLMITGKGRCNVTNNCGEEAFLAAVRRNPRFLYSAIRAFSTASAMAFFEELGVPLKTERGNRVFPVSDRAVDVVDAMASFVRKSGAALKEGEVTSLLLSDGRVRGVKTTDGALYEADAVLVATGGLSYPLTGSTGDGYRLAREAGHTVTDTQPSLVPLVLKEPFCAQLMGLSLKNVSLTVKKGQKSVFNELGEMLFTHFGVSGPLVLSASSHMEGEARNYSLSIDLKPGLTGEQLDARLLRDFEEAKNKAFRNALDGLLPRRLIPVAIARSKIAPGLQVNAVTREMRRRLLETLKDFTLTPAAFRPVDEAIVTSGGVNVREVDPKTMQSKITGGLYFAGEVLDLDAYTGGYNLQIAYSTGYLAGTSAGRRGR